MPRIVIRGKAGRLEAGGLMPPIVIRSGSDFGKVRRHDAADSHQKWK
jgi:hypothetical protein